MDRWTTSAIGDLLPGMGSPQTLPEQAPQIASHVLTRAWLDALPAKPDELLMPGALGAEAYEAAGGTLTRIAPRNPAARRSALTLVVRPDTHSAHREKP